MMPSFAPGTLLLLSTVGASLQYSKKRDVLYCSISERLRESARAASEIFSRWQTHTGAGIPSDTKWYIQYRSQRRAEKSLAILQALRRQYGNGGGTVDAPPALLDRDGLRLQCTLEELLVQNNDLHALAYHLAEAEVGTAEPVGKSLKKFAQAYGQLFDPAFIRDISVDGGPKAYMAGGAMSESRRVLADHHVIVNFLRLFVSLCSSEKPMENYANHPVHRVNIRNLSTVFVDGACVQLNIARKASLFTLAILGTDNISVEAFARLYDNYLTDSTKSANYSKVFAQAVQGLRKSVPSIETVNVRPNYRTIIGLSIDSKVSAVELKNWLAGRRLKVDVAERMPNS